MERRAGLLDGDDDPRHAGPTTGDERTVLLSLLDAQRATLVAKCRGAHDLAARTCPPSTLSLLGLVRHLADVERRWFRQVLAGEDVVARFSHPGRPDDDFDGAVDGGEDEAWAAWRDEVAFAETFVAGASLDDTGEDAWRGTVSLRWVLAHLVEEYARHNGHADLLRERLDGRVGL